MMSNETGKKRTGSGVSDPQGPAGVGGTVPAPSRSSSDDGLPPRSSESRGEKLTISENVAAKGLARMLARGDGKEGGARAPQPARTPVETSPEPSTSAGPLRRLQLNRGAFKRPDAKTLVEKFRENPISPEEEECLSEAMSTVALSGDEEDSPQYSDILSSDSEKAAASSKKKPTKRGPGRRPTAEKCVGVEKVRRELEDLRKEHDRVVAERDVLAGRLESNFEATPGGIPSADTFFEQMRNDSIGSLLVTVVDALSAVDSVADKSGNLKGTLKSVLRNSARRGVAASKLLFGRAQGLVRPEGGEEDSDRVRRDLRAAKSLIREADERIRGLEEENRILRAKETLRDHGTPEPSSKPRRPTRLSRRIPSSDVELEMEMEGPPIGEGPDPAIAGTSTAMEPSGLAPSLDLVVEQVVQRVMGRLRSSEKEIGPGPPPSSQVSPQGSNWTRVEKRRALRKRANKAQQPPPARGQPSSSSKTPPARGARRRNRNKGKSNLTYANVVSGPNTGTQRARKPAQAQKGKKKTTGVVREPRTAAVLLTCGPKASKTMAEILRETRTIAQETLSSVPTSLKRARAGGCLIQLGGEESQRRADELAAKMQQFLQPETDVRVVRPQKRAELRLTGLDASITPREVSKSIAELANCREDDLSIGEIRDSPTNRSGSVWIRCPVAVSNKILETKKWRIGWSTATARPLPVRLMRCFRCLEAGHAAALCKNQGVNRSGRCYRCGDTAHNARRCTAVTPKCPLCADFGLPAGHTLGAASCVPNKRAAEKKLAGLPKKTAQKEGSKQPQETRGGSRAAVTRLSRKIVRFDSCEDFAEAVRRAEGDKGEDIPSPPQAARKKGKGGAGRSGAP